MSKLTDIYCPACDRQHLDSLMISEPLGYRCQMQSHRYEYQRLMALKPRMKPYNFVEKQPASTVLQQVWVHPEAWTRLHEKYPTNLMTTICSLLTSLADGDTMIIEGEHVREMQALGVTRGRDMVGLAATNQTLSTELEAARIREKALEPLFRALGGAGLAAMSGATAGQPIEADSSSTARDLPARAPVVSLQPDPDGDYNPLGMMPESLPPAGVAGASAARAPAVRGIPRPSAPTNIR